MALTSLLSSTQITSLIQQASAAFQAPAGVLQAQEKPIQAKISALGQVQGALNSLQSALAGLADVQGMAQRTASVSPSGAVTASAGNTTPLGTYALSGIRLAQAESLISSGSASASGTLGSGTLAIKVGNGNTVTVNVPADQSSLNGIADAIDAADAGVQASVLFDGSKYRLVVTADATGTANAFTVTGTGALAGFSFFTGSSGLGEAQAAADASFSLNGFTVTSGSNTVTGVVPGLSLTLAASGAATVTVSQTSAALDNAAQSVVSALNTALSTIDKLTAFSPVSGAAPLLGDVGLEIVRTDLLNAISASALTGTAAAGAPFTSLSSIGFSVTSGGSVTFDDTAFQSAASTDYGAVASLLGEFGTASNKAVGVESIGSAVAGSYAVDVTANSGGIVTGTVNGQAASGTGGILVVNGAGPAQGLALSIAAGASGSLGTVTLSQGLFGSLSSVLSAALASGTGSVSNELTSLNQSITTMNRQVAALEQQAQAQTQLLTAQFTVAQSTLSQLETVSSFLNTFFNLPSGGAGG
jgi:flagellar hook-associated protein 2